MPRKIGKIQRNRSLLLNAPLPKKTKTYTVISHSFAINTILKALNDNGFTVKDETYTCTTGAKAANGIFVVNYQNDPDLEMVYTFTNSYDKSIRFRSAIGARIKINDAIMIRDSEHWLRKHTGTADKEAKDLINKHMTKAKDYFDDLIESKESMKKKTIDRSTFGEIIGDLFINHLLSVDQVSLIRKEYDNPSYPYDDDSDNLWTCYNHILYALKQSHPAKWMKNQIAIHLYFISKFNLVEFDDDSADDSGTQPEIGQNFEMPISVNSDADISDDIEHDGIKMTITDISDDGNSWVGEVIEVNNPIPEAEPEAEPETTVTIKGDKVTAIPGILDDVEETPLLPGFDKQDNFENDNSVEDEVQTSEPDPNQKTIYQEIEEREKEASEKESEDSQEEVEAVETKNEDQTTVDSQEVSGESEYTVNSDTNEKENESSDEVYFDVDLFEGIDVGEIIENDGEYFSITDKKTIGDEEYLIGVPFSINDMKDDEDSEKETETESVELPKESSGNQDTEEENTSEHSEDDGEKDETSEDPLEQDLLQEDTTSQTEDIPEVEEQTKQVEQTDLPDEIEDPVKDTIRNEIEEIYGEISDFTFSLEDGNYNVILDTGESMVFVESYIKDKL